MKMAMAGYRRGIILVMGILIAMLCMLLCFTQLYPRPLATDVGGPSIDIFTAVSSRIGIWEID